MKSIYLLILTSLFAISALAVESNDHGCSQPIIPNVQASPLLMKMFDKRSEAYKKCMQKYVEDQQAISKNSVVVDVANAAHEKAEAAIKEYNLYMDSLNERNKKAGSEDDN